MDYEALDGALMVLVDEDDYGDTIIITWRGGDILQLHDARCLLQSMDVSSPAIRPRCQVADFNLSKMMEETGSLASGGTMANMNPRWLAPEVLKGGRASVASDVFAFGVVLWGAPPSLAGQGSCWVAEDC